MPPKRAGGEVMSREDFPEPMLPSAPCAGAVEVPTRREQEALEKLKAIKTRVRELKQARGETGKAFANQTRDAIDSELHHLKEEWDRWEEERKEAARERMILLGHEES
jgi:chromosome segregation ATPase